MRPRDMRHTKWGNSVYVVILYFWRLMLSKLVYRTVWLFSAQNKNWHYLFFLPKPDYFLFLNYFACFLHEFSFDFAYFPHAHNEKIQLSSSTKSLMKVLLSCRLLITCHVKTHCTSFDMWFNQNLNMLKQEWDLKATG